MCKLNFIHIKSIQSVMKTIRHYFDLSIGYSLFLPKLIKALILPLIIVLLVMSNASANYKFPQYDNIYVNDYAVLLDEEARDRIMAYLQEAGAVHGVQITLLTIASLSHYDSAPFPRIEGFATALFNHWGVGDSEKNNGVLILISHSDRKMRIEIGSGYSSSWDHKMKTVIDDVFLPYFKSNDYRLGIEKGVIEVVYLTTNQYPTGIENSMFSKLKHKATLALKKVGAWAYAVLALIGGLLVAGVRYLWRKRPRSCDVCANKMTLLNEVEDNKYIEEPQQLEEYIGSVDYDVWRCNNCSKADVYRYKSLFTSYRLCSECQYQTLAVETSILEHASTTSQGLKRIDYRCKNCNFTDYETRVIPRKSESSSGGSGSSGGGSFGGGSSSGGGASGSW